MKQTLSKIIYSILTAVLLFFAIAIETMASPYFRNVSLEQAGPAYAIEQDDDGLIWVGTAQGLCCFDGYRLVPHREAGMDSIVYAVCCRNDKVIIGGTQGLSIYDRLQGRTVTIDHPLKTEVRELVTMNGQVYVGTNQGLYLLKPDEGKLTRLSAFPQQILALTPTDRGLLIGTMNGLYEYTDGRCRQLPVFDAQQQRVVSAIAYDRQTGKYWLGSFEHLYQYDLHTGELQVYQPRSIVVKALEVTPKGLFICADDGLYILKDGQVEHLVHDSRNPSSLGNNIVWDAFRDKTGNIYMGTDLCLSVIAQKGLADYSQLGVLTGFPMGNVLTSVMYDRQGMLWMGGTGGLIRMSSPVCWFLQNGSEYVLSHNRVRDICEDQEGNLWVSTDIGLNLYDRHHNRMNYRMLRDAQTQKQLPWVYDVMDDGQGHLWVATCDAGVYMVSRSRILQATYDCPTERHITGLSSQNVSQLVMAGGTIFARTSHGVDRIDAKTFQAKTLRSEHAELLCADRKGQLWVADRKEICIYAPDGELVNSIPFQAGLMKDKVVAMLEIDGDMWVITSLCCSVYRQNRWLTSVRIPDMAAHSACYDIRSHRIILGGEDATVTLTPRQILRQNHQQHLLLTNLLVNGKQVLPEASTLMTMKEITLSHEDNNLVFSLTDLPMQQMAKAVYAYRMKGLEEEWHFLQQLDEEIVYNSLPYGKYTLEVHVVDGFQHIGKQVYCLTVDILPPWYLTWWAKLFYTLLTIAIACAGVKLYLTRKDLRQEQQARKQIMDESSARIRFYDALYHNLHEGLGRIMSRLAMMSEREKAAEQLVDYRLLGFESTRLNAFVHQALDMGKSAVCETDVLDQQCINIVVFCDTTLRGLNADAGKRNIKVSHVSIVSQIPYCVNVIQWDTVFYSFLKSAIDYSCDGASIMMDMHEDATDCLFITLTCSSFAVQKKDLPFFFQRYYNLVSDEQNDRVKNMYLVKEFAEHHQGSVEARQGEKGQVILTLTLPLDKSRAADQTQTQEQHNMLSLQDEKLFKEITAAIEANMANSDFNVTLLQKEVGIGSKLLYRKVKAFTDMSPVEYIRDIRMKQAALLLAEGRFAISEVMYMVGFSNSGYFSKCFQKAFGTTPTNYMQQHREQ